MKNSVIKYLFQATSIAILISLGFTASSIAKECSVNDGRVSRAMFTTQIENREPLNRILILENDIRKVYFFTDLRHLEGHSITHRWEYDGHIVSEKVFAVKGPRWRVYSARTLDTDKLGRWTVVVVDDDGCPLKAVVFQYVDAKSNGEGSAIIDLK